MFKTVVILRILMGIIGFYHEDRVYTNVERAGEASVLMIKAGESRNRHKCQTEAKEQGREVFTLLQLLAEEDTWKHTTRDCKDFPKTHLLCIYLLSHKKVVLTGKL